MEVLLSEDDAIDIWLNCGRYTFQLNMIELPDKDKLDVGRDE